MGLLVSRDDLETLLTSVERACPDPRAGIFGPGSITWTLSRESAVFLGAGRAALLQLTHPWVAAALAQHSSLLNDPIARFHNTFRTVFTMIFGSLPQALAAARRLHTLHTHIQGELPESGGHYEANEIAALRWVYSTLIESAVLAREWVRPLTAADRESYYRESHTIAALFGLPASELPPDWEAFQEYNRSMAASADLGVSSAARSMANAILSGAGSWIHPPRWYRALTIAWLRLVSARSLASFSPQPTGGRPTVPAGGFHAFIGLFLRPSALSARTSKPRLGGPVALQAGSRAAAILSGLASPSCPAPEENRLMRASAASPG